MVEVEDEVMLLYLQFTNISDSIVEMENSRADSLSDHN